jgi:hypothetical protein
MTRPTARPARFARILPAVRSIAAAALAVIALALGSAGLFQTAHAGDNMRWPSASALPSLPKQPNSPPAVLERAPSAIAYLENDKQTRAAQTKCEPGKTCVVCVAACDLKAPVVLQQIKPQPTGAIAAASTETNSDGISPNAPKYARQDWAGITCGSESGCRVSGVSAPRRSSSDNDVRFSVFSYYGSYSGYSSSYSSYIDR